MLRVADQAVSVSMFINVTFIFFVVGLLSLLPETTALFIPDYFYKITQKFGFDAEPNHLHFLTFFSKKLGLQIINVTVSTFVVRTVTGNVNSTLMSSRVLVEV